MATNRDAERILESHLSNLGKKMVHELTQMHLYLNTRAHVTDMDRITTHLLQQHLAQSFVSPRIKRMFQNVLDDRCFDALQFLEHLTLLQPWSTHAIRPRYERIRQVERELLDLVNFDEDGDMMLPPSQDAALEFFSGIKHRAHTLLKQHADDLLEDGNILFFSPYTAKFVDRTATLAEPMANLLKGYKAPNADGSDIVDDNGARTSKVVALEEQYRRQRYDHADASADDLLNIDANIMWLSEDESAMVEFAKEMRETTGDETWTVERLQSCVIASSVAQNIEHTDTRAKKTDKSDNLGLVKEDGTPWGTPYTNFRLLNLTPDPTNTHDASGNRLQRLQPFDIKSGAQTLGVLKPTTKEGSHIEQTRWQSLVMHVDAHELYIRKEFKRMSALRHAFLQTRISQPGEVISALNQEAQQGGASSSIGSMAAGIFGVDVVSEPAMRNRAVYNSIKQDVACVISRHCADMMSVTAFNDRGRPLKKTWPRVAHMLDYMLLFAMDFYVRATPHAFFDRFVSQIFNLVLLSPSIKLDEDVETSLGLVSSDPDISLTDMHLDILGISFSPSGSRLENPVFDNLCASSMRFDLCLRSDEFWLIDISTLSKNADGQSLAPGVCMSLEQACIANPALRAMVDDTTTYRHLPLWRLPSNLIARPKMMENTLPLQQVCDDLQIHVDDRHKERVNDGETNMYQTMKGSALRLTPLPTSLERLCRNRFNSDDGGHYNVNANIPEVAIMPDLYNSCGGRSSSSSRRSGNKASKASQASSSQASSNQASSNNNSGRETTGHSQFILPLDDNAQTVRFANDVVTMYLRISELGGAWADANEMNRLYMPAGHGGPNDGDDSDSDNGYEGEHVRDRGWRMMSRAINTANVPSLSQLLKRCEDDALVNTDMGADIMQCLEHVGACVSAHFVQNNNNDGSGNNNANTNSDEQYAKTIGNLIIPNFAWTQVTERIAADALRSWVDTFVFHKLLWIATRARLSRPEVIAHFMQPIHRRFHLENFASNITTLVSTFDAPFFKDLLKEHLDTPRNVLATAESLYDACESIIGDATRLSEHLSSMQLLIGDMLDSMAITTTTTDTHDWHTRVQGALSSRMAPAMYDRKREKSLVVPETNVDVKRLFAIAQKSILHNGGAAVQAIMKQLPDVGAAVIREMVWEDGNLSSFYVADLNVLQRLYELWSERRLSDTTSSDIESLPAHDGVTHANYDQEDLITWERRWITYALQSEDMDAHLNQMEDIYDSCAWFTIPAPLRHVWMSHWYPHLEITYLRGPDEVAAGSELPLASSSSPSSSSSSSSSTKNAMSEFKIVARDRRLLCGDILMAERCLDEGLQMAPISIGRMPLMLQQDGPLGKMLSTFLSMLRSCRSCSKDVMFHSNRGNDDDDDGDDDDDDDGHNSIKFTFARSWRDVMTPELGSGVPLTSRIVDQPNHTPGDDSRPDLPGYGMFDRTICDNIALHFDQRQEIMEQYLMAKTKEARESADLAHDRLCRDMMHSVRLTTFGDDINETSEDFMGEVARMTASLLSMNSPDRPTTSDGGASDMAYVDQFAPPMSSDFVEEIRARMLSAIPTMLIHYFARSFNFATRVVSILHHSDARKRPANILVEFQHSTMITEPALDALLVPSLMLNPACLDSTTLQTGGLHKLTSNFIPGGASSDSIVSVLIERVALAMKKQNPVDNILKVVSSIRDLMNTSTDEDWEPHYDEDLD